MNDLVERLRDYAMRADISCGVQDALEEAADALEQSEAVRLAAQQLLDDVRERHPESKRDGFYCPYMRALDAALPPPPESGG